VHQSRAPDTNGRRQQRDLLREHLQRISRNFHPPKIIFVDKGVGAGKKRSGAVEVLCHPQARIELRRHIRRYILAVGVAAGEGQTEVPVPMEVRILKSKINLLLKQAVRSLN